MSSKDWYHEVSAEWLKERKLYLTATEIAGLVPEYKRTLKADPGTISPGFAALWAEKTADTEVDVTSYGPAARGHWMEQFAIESWNLQRDLKFFHWDDCIIAKGAVGFSPDAMTVPQSLPGVALASMSDGLHGVDGIIEQPKAILEVKSFDPSHHMKCVVASPAEQESKLLMQLATAFYVLDELEKAILVFYCPNAVISMKAIEYTREDLAAEIELVDLIAKKYRETVNQCTGLSIDLVAKFSEDEVYQTMVETVALDNGENILLF